MDGLFCCCISKSGLSSDAFDGLTLTVVVHRSDSGDASLRVRQRKKDNQIGYPFFVALCYVVELLPLSFVDQKNRAPEKDFAMQKIFWEEEKPTFKSYFLSLLEKLTFCRALTRNQRLGTLVRFTTEGYTRAS